MSYTNGLDKPSDYFNTSLWSGDGNAQTISGVGFQPDFLWAKNRSDSYSNILTDSVRGITKQLKSEGNASELTNAQGVTAFNADGYVLGTQADFAVNSNTFVGWAWRAGGSASSNSDGSTTSTVSANTTAGFSIVSYTGAGATTYGHGLGATPNVIIIKKRTSDTGNNNWFLYHDKVITAGASNKSFMTLNETGALTSNGTATTFTSVSDTTFGVGTDDIISESSHTFIAYCFAEKKGYSKFGSYVGNGSSSGPYIHLGYKPSLVIRKITSGSSSWIMQDNKRSESGGFNQIRNYLFADSSQAEVSNQDYFNIDFLSNGFKIRSTDGGANGSGQTYIYMAFAENPFVTSTGIPTTAR